MFPLRCRSPDRGVDPLRTPADSRTRTAEAHRPPPVASRQCTPITETGGPRMSGTIRHRIVLTLALPVAATLALLAVIAVDQVGNYRTASATARAVTLELAVQ